MSGVWRQWAGGRKTTPQPHASAAFHMFRPSWTSCSRTMRQPPFETIGQGYWYQLRLLLRSESCSGSVLSPQLLVCSSLLFSGQMPSSSSPWSWHNIFSSPWRCGRHSCRPVGCCWQLTTECIKGSFTGNYRQSSPWFCSLCWYGNEDLVGSSLCELMDTPLMTSILFLVALSPVFAAALHWLGFPIGSKSRSIIFPMWLAEE